MNRSLVIVPLMGLALLFAQTCFAQANGSFETGLVNWTAVPAANVTISSTADSRFPSDGAQFAVLRSSQTGPGVPGYGPHLPGAGSGQSVVLSRTFTRPTGVNCEVQIDWTLLNNEGSGSSFNDFISIDIIDVASNTLVQNMVFADTGFLAGTPNYNGVPGAGNGEIAYVDSQSAIFGSSYFEPLPHGFKRARAELGLSTLAGQALRIDVTVGNGNDGSFSSTVYVDNFKVLSGGSNSGAGALRVLGASSSDGTQFSGDSGGDNVMDGPIDFTIRPGQRIALRTSASSGGVAFAILTGTVRNDGSDFGFDEFNLNVSAGINTLVDGLNPSNPFDVLFGTLNEDFSFIEGALPITALAGEFGIIAIFADPTSATGLEGTATTRVEVKTDVGIPLGSTQVLDSGGSPLSDDDFGAVDLTGMSGGGFTFYGTLYTECFVGSNGYVTFGSGDADFTASVTEMYTQEPRIAPLWTDFSPNTTTNVIISSEVTLRTTTISWDGLAEFSSSVEGNSFSVQLHSNGSISIAWDRLTADVGVVGISPGGLAAPTGFLLDSTVGFSGIGLFNGNDTTLGDTTPFFQVFGLASSSNNDTGPSDIMTLGINGPARLSFVPDGTGYRGFAGTR
ncbi:MAG: hypothetical protein V3W41_12380 [Planctomycetota bacterium]